MGTRPVTPLTALPAERYTSPSVFQLELAALLVPSWQFACHESDLPGPGTAQRFDFCGRSAVVLRRPDRGLSAVVNVCRHRGSRLVDGDAATGLAFCIDGKLRCPAHGWTYDASGALESVPRESQYPGLERSAFGLRPLAVTSCQGWIFVAFEQPRDDFADAMGTWLARLEAYDSHGMRRLQEPSSRIVRANWKLLCEDRLEKRGHVSDGPYAAPDAAALQAEPAGDGVHATGGGFVASTTSTWPSRLYLAHLPAVAGLPSAQQRRWLRAFAWPNTVFDVAPDGVIVTQVLPGSARESVLREVYYGWPDVSREMRAARYLHRRLRDRWNATRVRVVERQQAGLDTLDYTPGPVAGDEMGLRWFLGRATDIT